MRKLILSLDFYERIKGDHHIYSKNGIPEIITQVTRLRENLEGFSKLDLYNLIFHTYFQIKPSRFGCSIHVNTEIASFLAMTKLIAASGGEFTLSD